MKGVILGLRSEDGEAIILGHDDKRYHLQKAEWKSACEPRVGMEIDFLNGCDDSAREAYHIQKIIDQASSTQKTKQLWERLPLLAKYAGIALVCSICIFLTVKLLNPVEHGNGERQDSQSGGQQISNEDVSKNALSEKGFEEGKEAGYLLGIDEARHNIRQGEGMIRTISKLSVQQTNALLKGQGRPTVPEDEANGIIEGYVQGYAEGQRKVFIDGQ